jgi:hypothetical protein
MLCSIGAASPGSQGSPAPRASCVSPVASGTPSPPTARAPAVDAAQAAERRKQPMSPAQVHAWRAGLQ